MGHERVMTTFSSYGAVAMTRQGEILATLNSKQATYCGNEVEQIVALLDRMRVPHRHCPRRACRHMAGSTREMRD